MEWEGGDVFTVVKALKESGYKVFGLDNTNGANTIDSFTASEKIALVLGNEVDGIDDETKKLLDGLIEIPMGKKRSLNVSVASGIAMYALGSK